MTDLPNLDDLEATARAAAEPAPETFSAAAFGAWAVAGSKYQGVAKPEVFLALIAKLREAEAVIAKARHELSARPIPHGVSQAIYYQAFMVRADMALAAYEPTNQEKGEET